MDQANWSQTSTISFQKFWQWIHTRETGINFIEKKFQEMLQNELQQHPEWSQNLHTDALDAFAPLFHLVQSTLVLLSVNRENLYWELATPVSPTVLKNFTLRLTNFYILPLKEKLLVSLPHFKYLF